jgi:hypothetical protein
MNALSASVSRRTCDFVRHKNLVFDANLDGRADALPGERAAQVAGEFFR